MPFSKNPHPQTFNICSSHTVPIVLCASSQSTPTHDIFLPSDCKVMQIPQIPNTFYHFFIYFPHFPAILSANFPYLPTSLAYSLRASSSTIPSHLPSTFSPHSQATTSLSSSPPSPLAVVLQGGMPHTTYTAMPHTDEAVWGIAVDR